MSRKILVTYVTNAGSTAEVAERIAETLRTDDTEAIALEMDTVDDVSDYSALVAGGPMIMGWHRKAVKFLKKNRKELAGKPIALFMTAMKIAGTDTSYKAGQVTIDQGAVNNPVNPARLSFKERHTTPEHYIIPVLKRAGNITPVSIGIFAGKLDYTKLKFPQMMFVMLIIGAKPGDRRNWDTITAWADSLKEIL